MIQIIVLDTGVLGMLVHPAETGEPRECKAWLKRIILGGASVYVPEIADLVKASRPARRVSAWRAIPAPRRWFLLGLHGFFAIIARQTGALSALS